MEEDIYFKEAIISNVQYVSARNMGKGNSDPY